jgi:peroxiredoxin Q/BCP
MAITLAPGDTAPDFTLPDPDGKSVTLSDLRGRKVIVYFYPAASTPGCTKQACDFRDNLASLQGDPDRTVLEAYGAYGEKKLYGKTVTGVIRSTFVIDESGTITQAQYNVKATGHVAKLRKDLGLP